MIKSEFRVDTVDLWKKSLSTRAPNGMGWDDKIVPWDYLVCPIPSHGIPKKKLPIPFHPMGSHGIGNTAEKFN